MLTVALVSLLGVAAAPAAADDPVPPPWLKVENGQTQPQFNFADAIEQTVFVETVLDSDRDGRRDRVRIRISRPRETETLGYKVPVVFEHSPYRGDFGPIENHAVDFDTLPQESLFDDDRNAARSARAARSRRATARSARARARARARMLARADLPGQLDNYYVPRGYAVVIGESIGTFNSDGCPTIGDQVETLGTRAVIDWLNGRARGFDAATGGNPVSAPWTDGTVGMTGVSYNGTLPNQVATTGVEGLETIIPVSAISSWYDYYRANGLVVAPHSEAQGVGDNEFLGEDTDVLASFIGGSRMATRCAGTIPFLVRAQDRVTGDWSPFWEARDYLDDVDRIRASVFVVHGLNDWNVKTKAFAEWWYRLDRYGVPRKIWLHNGGHGGPGPAGSPGAVAYKRAENRWFDHELFGVENGIMDEPRSTIQREDGSYFDEPDWPLPGARHATLRLSARSAGAPGELSPGWSWQEQAAEPELRRSRTRARHRRRADPGTGRGASRPADLPHLVAQQRRPPERHAVGQPADVGRESQRGEPHRRPGRLRPGRVGRAAGDGHPRLARSAEQVQREAQLPDSPRAGVRIQMGSAAGRLHLPGRPPDRPRGGVDRPRLHDPAGTGHPPHA